MIQRREGQCAVALGFLSEMDGPEVNTCLVQPPANELRSFGGNSKATPSQALRYRLGPKKTDHSSKEAYEYIGLSTIYSTSQFAQRISHNHCRRLYSIPPPLRSPTSTTRPLSAVLPRERREIQNCKSSEKNQDGTVPWWPQARARVIHEARSPAS